MVSKELMNDFYDRTSRTFSKLLDHCNQLTEEELNKKIEGFGYPTIRLQLHHVIAAERYWIGVLYGRIDVDEDDHLFPTIESLKTFKNEISTLVKDYLASNDVEKLVTKQTVMTWGNREKTIKPFDILMRTQTHYFHHQGQILAMCRLLGKPGEGLDYPID